MNTYRQKDKKTKKDNQRAKRQKDKKAKRQKDKKTKRQKDQKTKRQKDKKKKRKKDKKTDERVKYCDFRAVLYSCDVLYMTLLVTLISFEAAHFVLELSYAQSPFYLC